MQMAERLIRTKLHLPFTRHELVSRPRLLKQIARVQHCPLSLITAPTGFGKTTLVASCIAKCGAPVAWLSLDKDDNHIGGFLNYLVAALQEADHTIGNEAALLLAAAQQVPPETILTSLSNDLESTGKEMVLVLDDYQSISTQEGSYDNTANQGNFTECESNGTWFSVGAHAWRPRRGSLYLDVI